VYKEIDKNKSGKYKIIKPIILVLSAGLIFFLGISIGNGQLGVTLGNSVRSKKTETNKQLPANLNYTSVEQLYDALKLSYDGELDQTKLMDGIKKGLVDAAGNQYTEYLNEEKSKEFSDSLSGTFSGIGAELSKENNAVVVVAPISGYPADKAGVKSKDVIVKINDESALDMSVADAVNKIRGPEGTKVKLKIVRDGKQELDFDITRETITIPSVEHSIDSNNIGYIKISRFGEDTVKLTRQAAQEFKTKGVKGIVVDLRNDPGGLLDAAVDVSSLWLPKDKLILEEKRGGEVIKSYKSKGGDILSGVPTVILMNEGSASASEITAGALKDNGAATLIGTKSFGKGSVQELTKLSGGGVLKVTVARWYTPAGKNIDKEGIQPDKEVKLTEEDAKNKQDPQKDAAIQSLNK